MYPYSVYRFVLHDKLYQETVFDLEEEITEIELATFEALKVVINKANLTF